MRLSTKARPVMSPPFRAAHGASFSAKLGTRFRYPPDALIYTDGDRITEEDGEVFLIRRGTCSSVYFYVFSNSKVDRIFPNF